MQRHVALIRDAISDCPFELCREWQHGAEDFANRSEVIIGNPLAKFQQLLVEDRREIEGFDNFFYLDRWGLSLRLAIMQLDNDAPHPLLSERHQHAPADHRLHACRNGVGERHIERHGECNVAEEGH